MEQQIKMAFTRYKEKSRKMDADLPRGIKEPVLKKSKDYLHLSKTLSFTRGHSWWHALGIQKRAGLCESEATLAYTVRLSLHPHTPPPHPQSPELQILCI